MLVSGLWNIPLGSTKLGSVDLFFIKNKLALMYRFKDD